MAKTLTPDNSEFTVEYVRKIYKDKTKRVDQELIDKVKRQILKSAHEGKCDIEISFKKYCSWETMYTYFKDQGFTVISCGRDDVTVYDDAGDEIITFLFHWGVDK